MTRYNYNTQVTPPAPFIHVTLRPPVTSEASDEELPAQLDTGADITAIPATVVQDLELVELDEMAVMGFGGNVIHVPTYLVELTIRDYDPIVLHVLGNGDEPFVLLGRDTLNHFHITLDGPNQIVDFQ